MITLVNFFTAAQTEFTSVTKLIVDFGFFAILAACLVAAGVCSNMIPYVGPYLHAIRKDLYWAAFGCVLILFGEYVGAKAERAVCKSKTVVVEKIVTKAVKKTTTPAAKRQKDKWDRADY